MNQRYIRASEKCRLRKRESHLAGGRIADVAHRIDRLAGGSGGYEHAWANGLGEYIVSNDHLFDPNLNSTMNWRPMERQY